MSIFSKHNFKRLGQALKQEPPLDVIRNGFAFLLGRGKSITSSSLNVSSPKNDWILNIDNIFYSEYSDSIVVAGWFVCNKKVNRHTILINGKQVHLTHYRPDVALNYGGALGHMIDHAGFIFIAPSKKEKTILVELKSTQQTLVSHTLEVKSIQSIEHQPLSRNQQYFPYFTLKEHLFSRSNPNNLKGPKVSIIVPVYNVDYDYLEACVKSVLNQRYTNWELCICDDKSTRIDTISYLKSIKDIDPRIKIVFSEENQNISGASNKAIELATGEFVTLLDHDDVLHEDALYHVVKNIQDNPDVDILYSDEDKLDSFGNRVEPYYKPQYSRQLLLANNYICHLLTIRKTLGDSIGWFRLGYEGAQDHDLILRLVEQSDNIIHIPEILYHWRKIEGSTALAHGEKSYAAKAGLRSVSEALQRRGEIAKVRYGKWAGSYKVKYQPDLFPKITIVIPFKDKVGLLKTCMSSIFDKTAYPNLEILLVDNNSEELDTLEYLDRYKNNSIVKILKYDLEFNYSKINNWAVDQAEGEVILLLNNDIQIITKKWLQKMYGYLQHGTVGAVGAHLLYDDNTNQHNGLVLGIGGVAGHAFKGMPSHQNHYYLDGIPRNVSGCTAACLLFRKETWRQVEGLNEEQLKVAFNDVDFCLKIRALEKEIIYASNVQLYHFESKSRGYEDTPEKVARFKVEEQYMKDTWTKELANDPFYNPNLSLIRQDYGLNMEGVIIEYLNTL